MSIKLRVLVDAHMVGAHETGNETYIVNLLEELAKRPELYCGAVISPDSQIPGRLEDSSLDLIPLKSTNDWLRLASYLPKISRAWQADILHTTYISPLIAPCKQVVTVHDVVFKRYPDFFSPRDRILFSTLLPLTLHAVDAVITVSSHARDEILTFYPHLQGKVHVTLEAASSKLFKPINDVRAFERMQSEYEIDANFILAVGNLQPRKNLSRLIEAFSRIRENGNPLQLVIVGKSQWQSSDIYTLVKKLDLDDKVVFTGYVPDEDLAVLYNMAAVFVYPSLYEGFGLPVLEAMNCGTPVITSNCSSLPEVAGDAAILVDPYSTDAISAAMEKVLNDNKLERDLSVIGKDWSGKFSWAKTAESTMDIYQKIINN